MPDDRRVIETADAVPAPPTPAADARSRVRRALPLVAQAVGVGVLLLLTPVRVPRDDWGAAEGFTQVPGDAAISTLMAFAGMSVVAGILLGRHDRRLALALVCWPFATVLLTGTFVWGWGLGLLALAALGAQESWRRAALPFALLMTVVVAYCLRPRPMRRCSPCCSTRCRSPPGSPECVRSPPPATPGMPPPARRGTRTRCCSPGR
jgi:hypothetical protein